MGNTVSSKNNRAHQFVPQSTLVVPAEDSSLRLGTINAHPKVQKKSTKEWVVVTTDGLALWNKLPRDVKRLVFFFFPLKELIRLSTVCRTWSEDIYLGIRKLNFQPFYLVRIPKMLLKKQKITEESLNKILSRCENISSINLSYCSRISISTIKAICLSTKTYSLRILHLDLSNCGITDEGMKYICKYLTNLTSLSCSEGRVGVVSLITDESKIPMASLIKLRSLDLSYTKIQLPNWEETFLKLTNLESLTLVNLRCFVPMFSHLTNLKHLDMRGDIIGNLSVVSSLTNLETLMIGVCSDSVDWKALKALPKLSYIKIKSRTMGNTHDRVNFNEGRAVKCEINKID